MQDVRAASAWITALAQNSCMQVRVLGSCFPKDTLALAQTARELGEPTSIIEAVAAANRRRKNRMAQKVIDACGGSVVDKTIAILGLAFKQNTDDIREAPAIDDHLRFARGRRK